MFEFVLAKPTNELRSRRKATSECPQGRFSFATFLCAGKEKLKGGAGGQAPSDVVVKIKTIPQTPQYSSNFHPKSLPLSPIK